jgi:hypothetical protein
MPCRVAGCLLKKSLNTLGLEKIPSIRGFSKNGMPARPVGRSWKFQRVEVDTWAKPGGYDESKTTTEE